MSFPETMPCFEIESLVVDKPHTAQGRPQQVLLLGRWVEAVGEGSKHVHGLRVQALNRKVGVQVAQDGHRPEGRGFRTWTALVSPAHQRSCETFWRPWIVAVGQRHGPACTS